MRYLLIAVLLAGCGSESRNEAPTFTPPCSEVGTDCLCRRLCAFDLFCEVPGAKPVDDCAPACVATITAERACLSHDWSVCAECYLGAEDCRLDDALDCYDECRASSC